MSNNHYLHKKLGLENDQRNTNIHKIKRQYGQAFNPRDSSRINGGSNYSQRDDFPSNDAQFRKAQRFKAEFENRDYQPEPGFIPDDELPMHFQEPQKEQYQDPTSLYLSQSKQLSSTQINPQMSYNSEYQHKYSSRDRRSDSRDRHYYRRDDKDSRSRSRKRSYHRKDHRYHDRKHHRKYEGSRSSSSRSSYYSSSSSSDDRRRNNRKRSRSNDGSRRRPTFKEYQEKRYRADERSSGSPYSKKQSLIQSNSNRDQSNIKQERYMSPHKQNYEKLWNQQSESNQQAVVKEEPKYHQLGSKIDHYTNYHRGDKDFDYNHIQGSHILPTPPNLGISQLQSQYGYPQTSQYGYNHQQSPQINQQQITTPPQNFQQSPIIPHGIQNLYQQTQIQQESRSKVSVQDVALIYYTLARGEYKKWHENLQALFGNDLNINQQVFQNCEIEFKKSISRESQNLSDKVRRYADKNTIMEFMTHQEAKETDILSTQEDLSFFDSSYLVQVPTKYTGIKLPLSAKVDELKKQIAQQEKDRIAKEAKVAELVSQCDYFNEQLSYMTS